MGPLCTENSLKHTQSYMRIPVSPEIRDLTSVPNCTQGLHAVLRVGIILYTGMCFLLKLLPTQNSDHITQHYY